MRVGRDRKAGLNIPNMESESQDSGMGMGKRGVTRPMAMHGTTQTVVTAAVTR